MASEVTVDVVVVGSGAAGLAAALAASVDGAKVIVLEKSPVLGGTTAMSSAGTWVPANHHMLAAGLEDSPEETLAYLRATAPPGWANDEDALWQAWPSSRRRCCASSKTRRRSRFELVNIPTSTSRRRAASCRPHGVADPDQPLLARPLVEQGAAAR